MLYLGGDSLLAVKITLVFCFGEYFMMMLKFFYADPHPYWVTQDIDILQPATCNKLDFATPVMHLFNCQSFYGYMIYNFFYKYTTNPNRTVFFCSEALILILLCFATVMNMVIGSGYLYQCILTYMYTFIYLSVLIIYDRDIMAFCEEAIFIKRTSRIYKFKILFYIIILFIIASVIVADSTPIWVSQQEWL